MYVRDRINVLRRLAFICAAVTGLRENDICDEDNELSYCGNGLVCYQLHNETDTKCITRNMYIKLTSTLSKCFLELLLTDLTSNALETIRHAGNIVCLG